MITPTNLQPDATCMNEPAVTALQFLRLAPSLAVTNMECRLPAAM